MLRLWVCYLAPIVSEWMLVGTGICTLIFMDRNHIRMQSLFGSVYHRKEIISDDEEIV